MAESTIDKILQKINPDLKYEHLNYLEREEVNRMLTAVNINPLSIEDLKKYMRSLITAVENELIDTDEFVYVLIFKRVNRKHILLKARLKNYLLIEAFLYSRERASQAMERYIDNLKPEIRK